MKIKLRHIAAGLFVLASWVLTPMAVTYSYHARGYLAYGGEWLILLFGMALALASLEVGKAWDKWVMNQEINRKAQCERRKQNAIARAKRESRDRLRVNMEEIERGLGDGSEKGLGTGGNTKNDLDFELEGGAYGQK